MSPAARSLRRPLVRSALLWIGAVALVALLWAVHLGQGTSGMSAWDVLGALVDSTDTSARDVLLGSRLPRAVTGLVAGAALGASGAALQSVLRNPLASPETLGVSAGASLAVIGTTTLGLTVPTFGVVSIAFIGGLGVGLLALSLGGAGDDTKLVLAGSALSLAASAVTTVLLIMNSVATTGLLSWMHGSLLLTDLDGVRRAGPVAALALGVVLALARRVDLLGLGDDAARSLGVRVLPLRVGVLCASVLLAACTVTMAGPLGFVGLCAPVLVSLMVPWVPVLRRTFGRVLASALVGSAIVLLADITLRATLGADAGSVVPSGVVTTVLGGLLLIALARRAHTGGASTMPAPVRSTRALLLWIPLCSALLLGAAALGLLLGDRNVLGGDLLNWVQGRTGVLLTYVLDARAPRVLAALLAGAALAGSGAVVQGVVRNPLADPGLLGVTSGAGLAAVLAGSMLPGLSPWAFTGIAALGGSAAFALVLLLSTRHGGLAPQRVVLVGLGVAAACGALTMTVVVLGDPFNTARALTWLAGTTWGRTAEELWPVACALLLVVPLAVAHRRLDALAVDDDLARSWGVRLGRERVLVLGAAAVLSAASVTAVGVVGFVGLVAPHIARSLVGGRARSYLPVAVLIGAVMTSVADTIGRTALSPTAVPIGAVTAIVGAPYFVLLLRRAART